MISIPRRHHFTLTIGEIRELKAAGVISAAPENRAIIANRPRGTCDGYWNSVRTGVNPGQMLGYSLDDCDVFADAAKTKVLSSRSIKVTDFGHRFDWLTGPADKITFTDGNTLASLQTAFPDKYSALMNTEVAVSISTHPDKTFLKNFVKEEYLAVNTTSTPLEGGELVRGLPENASRADPETMAAELIELYYPNTSSARDNRLLLKTGIVSGAAKGVDNFHRKTTGDDNVVDAARDNLSTSEITIAITTLRAIMQAEEEMMQHLVHTPAPDIADAEARVQTARQIKDLSPREAKAAAIVELKNAEKHLKELQKADKADKKAKDNKKKIVDNRVLDHPYMGPILYGFRDAAVRDLERDDGLSTEIDLAKGVYVRWMLMSLDTKNTWSENRKDVATRYGDNNSARYYNESRFKAGWTRMNSMLSA